MVTKTLDQKVKLLIAENIHLLVPWYLILSYAYYHLNVSLISDNVYDQLCRELRVALGSSKIIHRHMGLCDIHILSAGTAYHLKPEDYPGMAISCAKQFVQEGYTT